METWWSPERTDHVTVATAAGRAAAQAAGYGRVRIEGWGFPAPNTLFPQLVALTTYWHRDRLDNVATTNGSLADDARRVGYVNVRVEAWLLPPRNHVVAGPW